MKKEELIKALCHATYAAWQLSLNCTPSCMDAFKEMKDIRVGDLVVEITSLVFRQNYNDLIGYVVDFGPSKYGCERAVLLKKLSDGKQMIWDNCEFVRVPFGESITRPWERKMEPQTHNSSTTPASKQASAD